MKTSKNKLDKILLLLSFIQFSSVGSEKDRNSRTPAHILLRVATHIHWGRKFHQEQNHLRLERWFRQRLLGTSQPHRHKWTRHCCIQIFPFAYSWSPRVSPPNLTISHKQINISSLVTEHRNSYSNLRLSDWFNRPGVLEQGNNFDDLTRGMATQPELNSDPYSDSEVKKNWGEHDVGCQNRVAFRSLSSCSGMVNHSDRI